MSLYSLFWIVPHAAANVTSDVFIAAIEEQFTVWGIKTSQSDAQNIYRTNNDNISLVPQLITFSRISSQALFYDSH